MQTFIPYRNCAQSARVLDNKRLGKQRVECLQIINSLCGVRGSAGQQVPVGPKDRTWLHHPASQMWRHNLPALTFYGLIVCKEWRNRGFNDSLLPHFNQLLQELIDSGHEITWPEWWGDPDVHHSHQANLVRKDPKFYTPIFGDIEPMDEYIWPTQ
jgi:hypothetical protein